jgi:uncharacterized protein (DUF58 family)
LNQQELISKVRQVEIKTKGLSNNIFAGDYHTAFKGRGMSFSEVREYAYGDDVRNIDWNVSARATHPYIKVFEEERELTMMLLVDVSKSGNIGSTNDIKRNYITELSATLAFSALKNNDKVGVIFFSDKVDKYIPAKKGRTHVLHIIQTLLTISTSQTKATDVSVALKFFNNISKQKNIAFVISDFISEPYSKDLIISQRKHDVVGLHVYDTLEQQIPDVGLLKTRNIETNEIEWLDTSSKLNRTAYANAFTLNTQKTKKLFGHNFLSFDTQYDYVKLLHAFFKQRN